MVFSTVQISIPGMSCARSSIDVIINGITSANRHAILTVMDKPLAKKSYSSRQIESPRGTTDTTLLPHSGVVIWCSRELGGGHTGMALGAPRDGEVTWQHANDGWLNSMAQANRHPA